MTDTNPPREPQMQLHRLVYRSHSRIPQDERKVVLGQIFNVARTNNKAVGVTGALLITDHYFVQTLEGEEALVRSLFDRISGDDRHENVMLMDERSVDSRIFSRWAMAEVSAAGDADIPLHAVEGGIGPAAQRPTTRDQDGVLTFMRNSIGADAI